MIIRAVTFELYKKLDKAPREKMDYPTLAGSAGETNTSRSNWRGSS
jgi:hypothetical protein